VGVVALTIVPSPKLAVDAAESVKLEPDIVEPAPGAPAGSLNVQNAVGHTIVLLEYTLLT
tara:strand:- start:2158 stop:2337 length:180 start_codon:yes stop_codon:yes gene_type:complete